MIWNKFEDFCKPQTSEVRTRFDILTCFRLDDMSVDEWYNAVQAQINLAKYQAEMAKILHRDIFWFFIRDEEFVSKTINDFNIDLEKFPSSEARQFAKRSEASISTARPIKKMSSDQQAPYNKNEFENKKFNPRQILQSGDRCHKCGDSQTYRGISVFSSQISVKKLS